MHLDYGIKAMLPLIKTIEQEENLDNKRVVKLRFTSKQYASFRDACKVFELVSADPGFIPLVKAALGSDIREQTIQKQLVDPIVDAPTKIPMKVPKLVEEGKKKESYFTAPTQLTKNGLKLYSKVADIVDKDTLRCDVSEGVTCITDIRIMVTKYLEKHDLKTDLGTVLDNLLFSIAPDTIRTHKVNMLHSDKKLIIPKGDRKIITGIINEITFEGPKEEK